MNRSNMVQQATLSRKTMVTNFTFERLFLLMSHNNMYIQVTFFRKLFVTKFTFICFFFYEQRQHGSKSDQKINQQKQLFFEAGSGAIFFHFASKMVPNSTQVKTVACRKSEKSFWCRKTKHLRRKMEARTVHFGDPSDLEGIKKQSWFSITAFDRLFIDFCSVLAPEWEAKVDLRASFWAPFFECEKKVLKRGQGTSWVIRAGDPVGP